MYKHYLLGEVSLSFKIIPDVIRLKARKTAAAM